MLGKQGGVPAEAVAPQRASSRPYRFEITIDPLKVVRSSTARAVAIGAVSVLRRPRAVRLVLPRVVMWKVGADIARERVGVDFEAGVAGQENADFAGEATSVRSGRSWPACRRTWHCRRGRARADALALDVVDLDVAADRGRRRCGAP